MPSASDRSRTGADGPARPSLGPLFFAACASWAGCMLSEELAWRWYASGAQGRDGIMPAAAVLAVLVVSVLVVYCLIRKGKVRPLVVPIIGLVCGTACGLAFWGAWPSMLASAQGALARDGSVEVEVISDAVERDYGLVSVARLSRLPGAPQLRLLWPSDTSPLTPGCSARVRGSLSAPKDNDGGRYNHKMGYLGMMKVTAVEDLGSARSPRGLLRPFRDESTKRIEKLGGVAAGLMSGVLLGNRTLYTGTQAESDFRATGLAHLMAVSGTHLAVVTVLANGLLAAVQAPRRLRVGVLGLALVSYTALTGFAPSAVRACCMCVAATFAGLAKRRAHPMSALSLCVIVFVGLDPPVVFSVGFLLSVLAICGLLVFGPLVDSWVRALAGSDRLQAVCAPLAASLSATALTVPVTVSLFAQLPLVGPFATLLAAPLITVVLGLGLCGLLLAAALPAAGQVLLQLSAAAANGCAALVHALASLPLSCLPVDNAGGPIAVACAAALVVLWVCWPVPRSDDSRRTRRAKRLSAAACMMVPFAVAIALGFATDNGVSETRLAAEGMACYVMVDVGQGDCSLIRDGGHAVLVDTGEDGTTLLRGMARQGVTHLDAVFLTHKDADHCGALSSLAGIVGVDHVFVHEDLLDDHEMSDVLADAQRVTRGRGAEGGRPGDAVRVGRFTITLLAPKDGGESENQDSLVHLVEYDADGDGAPEARGFMSGDAESEDLRGVLPRVGKVDFLKVPHHGSRSAVTDEDLEVLRPRVAVIGVGADNDYGHPAQETLRILEHAHVKVYRTDEDGDITLGLNPTRMLVSTQSG